MATNRLSEMMCIFTDGVMMPSAYVLFTVESGSEEQVLNDLRKTGEITESYVSYGVYDLIVKVRADTMENLKSLITSRVRPIKNVRSTLTLILLED